MTIYRSATLVMMRVFVVCGFIGLANIGAVYARECDSNAVSGISSVTSAPQFQQQISFDADGKIMRMTWEMEKQYLILRHYPHLYEARLFQTGDTSYLLELLHAPNGKMERELKPISFQEFSRIRYETSDAVRSFGMFLQEERTAVWEDWAVGVGGGLFNLAQGLLTQGGIGIQRPPGQRDEPPSVWWIPFVANSGVYIWAVNQPWYNRPAATLWSNGLIQGTAHGWAAYLLTGPQTFDVGNFLLAGMIMSTVEASAGLAISQFANISTPQAHMIASFGGSGLYLAVLAQLAAGTSTRALPANEVAQLVGASALVGSGLGMWLGNSIGRSPSLTGGDVLVFTTPANAIGTAPLAILTATQQNTSLQIAAGVTAAGIVGGHVLGNVLVQNKDFSFLQGRVINIASWLGGYLPNYVLNNAIVSATLNGQTQQAQSLQLTAAVASLVGSVAGFTIPYLIYAKEAEEQHLRRLAATGAQTLDGSLPLSRPIPHERTWLENLAANTDIQFSPLGLLPLFSPGAAFGLGLGAINAGVMNAGAMNFSLPIVNIRTTFGANNPAISTDEDAPSSH
ncbi:MAG: hypothetical protein MUF71_04800 [Candidatus Kapabacteria bacterium]|nr:hypothetical protein [Candidatus Kapabacteria bacterium]